MIVLYLYHGLLGGNPLPSAHPMAIFNPYANIWIFLINCLGLTIHRLTSSCVYSIVLFGLSTVVISVYPSYRMKRMRIGAIASSLIILTASITTTLVDYRIISPRSTFFTVLAYYLCIKISQRINFHFEHAQIFDAKNTSAFRRSCAIQIFESLHIAHLQGTLTHPDDHSQYLFYTSQYEHYCLTHPKYSAYGTLHAQPKESFYLFFLHYLENIHEDSFEMMKLMLFFQILCILDRFSVVRVWIEKAREKCGVSLVRRFEVFAVGVAMQWKIDVLYAMKAKAEFGEEVSLCGLYDELLLRSRMLPSPQFLDINIVLEHKNRYIQWTEKIAQVVNTHKLLFTSLKDDKHSNSEVLLHLNKKLYLGHKQLKREAKSMLRLGEETPTYFYAGCIFYFGTIRLEIEKAQEILNKYVVKLSRWENMGPVVLAIDKYNLERESVVLQVTLQKEFVGNITDITPDFALYLGKLPPNKEVIGFNINDLFPPFISDYHKTLMQDLGGFFRLLNAQRRFFINGFDGFLRELCFIVKISPNLQNGVTSTGILRIKKQKDEYLTLVGHDMEVLGLEHGLAYHLGSIDSNSPILTNLKMLSKKLCTHVDLTQKYLTTIKPFKESIENDKRYERSAKVLEILESIRMQNETIGRMYLVDHDSPYYRYLKNTPFTARFKMAAFKSIPYIELYITFRYNYQLERQIKSEYRRIQRKGDETAKRNAQINLRKFSFSAVYKEAELILKEEEEEMKNKLAQGDGDLNSSEVPFGILEEDSEFIDNVYNGLAQYFKMNTPATPDGNAVNTPPPPNLDILGNFLVDFNNVLSQKGNLTHSLEDISFSQTKKFTPSLARTKPQVSIRPPSVDEEVEEPLDEIQSNEKDLLNMRGISTVTLNANPLGRSRNKYRRKSNSHNDITVGLGYSMEHGSRLDSHHHHSRDFHSKRSVQANHEEFESRARS
jgi:hypothetical protein